jgi:hypothetical protein
MENQNVSIKQAKDKNPREGKMRPEMSGHQQRAGIARKTKTAISLKSRMLVQNETHNSKRIDDRKRGYTPRVNK